MNAPTKPHPSIAKQLRIVADYVEGIPIPEIVAKFGVSDTTICELARKCGCPPRPRGFTSDNARKHQQASTIKRREKRELLDRISAALIANDLIGARLEGVRP